MRRDQRVLLASLACCALAAACAVSDEPPELVVLVTIDTLRADHLGSYAYARARTPNLDRLAREGVRFEHATTTSNNTLPAHASILTGQHPQSLGLPRNSFPLRGATTIAQHFRDAGYETAAFISASALTSKMGLASGFDHYDEMLRVREIDQQQRRAGETTDAALAWLSRRSAGPAFVWIHYFDPHYPYTPPAPFDSLYGDDYTGPADGSMAYLMGVWGKGPKRIRPSEEDLQRLVDLYDGEIAYTDAQVGRLLAWIDDAGQVERSLVAVTADHGESLTEHGYLFNHGLLLYEPSLRVPLLLRLPASQPAAVQVIDSPVQILDLFPTLLQVAGLPLPEGTEGRSLLPLVRGEPGARIFSFAESCRPWSVERMHPGQYRNLHKAQAVVEGPWQLIATPYKQKLELYHTQRDPAELHNRVAQEPEVTARLHRALKEWRRDDLPPGSPPDPENLEQLKALGYVH